MRKKCLRLYKQREAEFEEMRRQNPTPSAMSSYDSVGWSNATYDNHISNQPNKSQPVVPYEV